MLFGCTVAACHVSRSSRVTAATVAYSAVRA